MPSKYTHIRQKEYVRPYTIHPIWRGIGFVMLLLVPVISWTGATVFIKFAKTQALKDANWAFINELTGFVRLPDVLYGLPVISILANQISKIADLRAQLLFSVAALIIFSGIVSVLYAFAYRIVGPPRYTYIDAPMQKARTKRYTR